MKELNPRRWPKAMILWLRMSVHWDAFRLDPFGYVQSGWWRMRGLRVRSRHRLAPLIGQSPKAYALWIAAREAGLRSDLLSQPPSIADTAQGVGEHDGPSSIAPCGAAKAAAVVDQAVPIEVVQDRAKLAELVGPDARWLCILGDGDRLAPDAIQIYAKVAAVHPGSWVIYSDDDLIDSGTRRAPHFKSGWNPELFEHHDFITNSAIIRVTPDMLASLSGSDWAKQLTDQAITRGRPVHLPAVLHHRMRRPSPAMPARPSSMAEAGSPLVTIIVPTRNRVDLLRECISGVTRTAYPRIELIVVDNESDDPQTLSYLDQLRRRDQVKILSQGGAFNFSALNNHAVQDAAGDLLCFLNNDVEMIEADWLALLVARAVQDDIGAVGARLLYPDGSVQHAGVVVGVGGGAGHAHRLQRDDDPGYFLRDRLPQRVTAVTAACMVVAREKFMAVGGFDEQHFPVAFNDVDLCLKLNARGWQSFYEPAAVLIHHESKSRGSDRARGNRTRFAGELATLKRLWATDEACDPYHHPFLSRFSERFHIAL